MKFGDIFCGAGGFSEGLEQAGHECVFVVDNWDKAIETHRQNHPNSKHILSDIIDFDGIPYRGKIDLLVGSPPCQAFSTANQNPNLIEGVFLVNEFLRVLVEIQPKYWVLENIPPLKKHLKVLQASLLPNKRILNSADFGVAQERRRLFAGYFPKPIQTHSKVGVKTLTGDILKSWIGWADVLNIGYNYPVELVTNVGESLYRYHKLNVGHPPKKPSATLNTACPPRIYKVKDRKKVRALTLEEMQIIQGFCPDYKLIGDRAKLIGNSVCPPVARAIGEALLREQNGEATSIPPSPEGKGILEEFL